MTLVPATGYLISSWMQASLKRLSLRFTSLPCSETIENNYESNQSINIKSV